MDSLILHVLAFLATLSLFGVQATLLNMFIISNYGTYYYFIVVLDAQVVIALIATVGRRSISKSSSVINLLNSIDFSIKALIIGRNVRLSNDLLISDKVQIGVLAIFCLTPMFVALLGLRGTLSSFMLSYEVVTPESFLGLETVFRVVLDQFDAIMLFSCSSMVMEKIDNRLYVVCLGMLAVVLILHSFSIPSLVLWDDQEGIVGHSVRLDLIMTAKHCALVSLFVVDIPMIVIRCVLWRQQPEYGLNLFIYKNLMGLGSTCLALHRTQLLEKGTTAFGVSLGVISEDESQVENAFEGEIDDIRSELLNDREASARKSDVIDKKNRIVQDVVSVRRLPVHGFSFRLRIKTFIRMALGLNLASTSPAMLLDGGIRYSTLRSLLLSIPISICNLSQAALVVLILLSSDVSYQPVAICSSTTCLYAYILVGAVTTIHFMFFVWNAPFISTVMQSLYVGIQNLSFFFLISDIAYSEVFSTSVATRSQVVELGSIPLLMFIIPSVISLMYSILPMYNACLGRSHLVYQKTIPTGGMDKEYLSQSIYTQSDDMLDESHYTDVYTVSTLGCIIYAGTRDHIAPPPLNELLIGNNLIKALRCADNLNMSNYFRLYYKIFTRGTCIFAFFNYFQACVYIMDILCKLNEYKEWGFSTLCIIRSSVVYNRQPNC